MLCDDLEEWDGGSGREAQEGRDVCVHMANSLSCTVSTDTTVQSNYKSNKKRN